MAVLQKSNTSQEQENILCHKKYEKPYRLTPYIVTLCEGTLTDIDIENLLEVGLRLIRFKISHVATSDKVLLISYLKKAIASCGEKHDNVRWPVAISVDLPNACILTGYLKDEIHQSQIFIRTNTTVEFTCDSQYWNRCDEKRIFIDDPFTLPTLVVGNEISINFGAIVLICIEVINSKCLKCKVELGGFLGSAQFVCIRGVRHKRPNLSKLDRRLLEFVKDNELDGITIHSIRNPGTVAKIRDFFKDSPVKPFIMCSICEQEGLDKVDSIIEVADAVILAREFLSQAIINPNRLTAIQMYISAKCRQHNKPFYISGSILEHTMKYGTVTCSEINDVDNAVMQGAGFLLRSYSSASNILATIEILNELCRAVESVSMTDDFWPLCLKSEPPINAADAAIYACALTARQTMADVIIVLTVTGRSAAQLARMVPQSIIFAVTTSVTVAKWLQLYRCVVPLVYEKSKTIKDWYIDMVKRVEYAVEYGLKTEFLSQDKMYVVLRKATTSSAFCDQISTWRVGIELSKKTRLRCPDHS